MAGGFSAASRARASFAPQIFALAGWRLPRLHAQSALWPGLMHVVGADGAHATLLDTRAENRYLNDFLLVGAVLYQPHWEPSAFSAYAVAGAR